MEIKNEWLGIPGFKVNIEVVKTELLYVQEPFASGGDPTYHYKLFDSKGHVILWSTSQPVPNQCKLMAKIKDIREYQGIKETIITRGKIYAI